MFKVKALTLKTRIFHYIIPGIRRVLQNSDDLKKLTVHTIHCDIKLVYIYLTINLFWFILFWCSSNYHLNPRTICFYIFPVLQAKLLDHYLTSQAFNKAQLCPRLKDAVHWDVKSKHLPLFVELVLKNTKTLDKMFLVLDHRYRMFRKIIGTLSRNDKVSISLDTYWLLLRWTSFKGLKMNFLFIYLGSIRIIQSSWLFFLDINYYKIILLYLCLHFYWYLFIVM